ncbi:SPASM domain-containing protein, partial [Microbacteriaceae bacterium K1510]|nr:SPASM domain-containing protein [Microbacteriaceae bacterium K1510]
DQFSQQINLGSLREKSFSEIWNGEHPVLEGLRNRREKITGRCGSCAYFPVCNGNFRPRAYGFHGDYWASDPQCYLSDAEIGIE